MSNAIDAGPIALLTARAAAKSLSICEKTLWSLAKRGALPAVRIGRAVRYDPADLSRYIDACKGSTIALNATRAK